MRKTLKAAFFVSAFSPCLISIGVARLWAGEQFWDAIYYVAAGIIGSLAVFYILHALKWKSETFTFEVKKIESYDAVIIGVIATYMAPFLVKASELTFGTVVALVVFLFVVFWFTDASVPSPLMRIFSFRFYKAEAASGMVYTLITDREILDPSNVTQVKKITSSMLLESRN